MTEHRPGCPLHPRAHVIGSLAVNYCTCPKPVECELCQDEGRVKSDGGILIPCPRCAGAPVTDASDSA